jgi:hypothetical protein
LRIHTTNDRFGTRFVVGSAGRPFTGSCLSSAASRRSTSTNSTHAPKARTRAGEGHSQLDNLVVYAVHISPRPANRPIGRHPCATASISRTHSQCQRGAKRLPIRAGRSRRETGVFIPGGNA